MVTRGSITSSLKRTKLNRQSTLMVHASLSQLGWVCGGPVAVLDAITDVMGPGNTVVAPTFTPDMSDPSRWKRPAIPEAWWDEVRTSMQPFDPYRTASRGMGAVAELIRTSPGALRSSHPQTSFAAQGPCADQIVFSHPLSPRLGLTSPLGTLRELDAWVMLLGVGFSRNTSFHLADYEAEYPGQQWMERLVPQPTEGGGCEWKLTVDLRFYEKDFNEIGRAFLDKSVTAERVHIGRSTAIIFSMDEFVEFARRWMTLNRDLRHIDW